MAIAIMMKLHPAVVSGDAVSPGILFIRRLLKKKYSTVTNTNFNTDSHVHGNILVKKMAHDRPYCG